MWYLRRTDWPTALIKEPGKFLLLCDWPELGESVEQVMWRYFLWIRCSQAGESSDFCCYHGVVMCPTNTATCMHEETSAKTGCKCNTGASETKTLLEAANWNRCSNRNQGVRGKQGAATENFEVFTDALCSFNHHQRQRTQWAYNRPAEANVEKEWKALLETSSAFL